jgi:Mg/Co/Ni transporter MgtE
MLNRGAAYAALFGCCLVAVDGALLAAFWTRQLDWPMALVVHLALCLVVVLAGRSGTACPDAGR